MWSFAARPAPAPGRSGCRKRCGLEEQGDSAGEGPCQRYSDFSSPQLPPSFGTTISSRVQVLPTAAGM